MLSNFTQCVEWSKAPGTRHTSMSVTTTADTHSRAARVRLEARVPKARLPLLPRLLPHADLAAFGLSLERTTYVAAARSTDDSIQARRALQKRTVGFRTQSCLEVCSTPGVDARTFTITRAYRIAFMNCCLRSARQSVPSATPTGGLTAS